MTKHEWHLLTGLPTDKAYISLHWLEPNRHYAMGDKPGKTILITFKNPRRFQKQIPFWHSSLHWWDEGDVLAAQFNRDFPNQTHLLLGKFQRLLDKKEKRR